MRCFDEFGDPCMPERLQGCYFNVSGGASQAASNPVVNPEVFGLLKSNVAGAQAIAAKPVQQYGQPMTAGMSPTQQYAGQSLVNNAFGAGNSTLNLGIDAANSLIGFKPSNVTAGNLPGTDLSGYMNPYQKNVTDTTMADIERQREIQRVTDQQSGTAAKAFGGSRSGVADALTNEASQRTGASTLANLNYQNFNNAQGMATGDLNRTLSAAQSNQNAGIAGAGVNQSGGALANQIGNSQSANFLNSANAISQYGQQEQTTQQNALTQAYQEFLRQQNYPVEMQQLISQAMGLVPGAIGQSSKSSSFNFGAGIA